MSRPAILNVTLSVHNSTPLKAASGDVITVYADNGAWNETQNKVIKPEDLIRK